MSRVMCFVAVLAMGVGVAGTSARAEGVSDDMAPGAGDRFSRPSFAGRFAAANTTHDGHLTLDQARNGHLKLVTRHFDRIDRQHKGYVTLKEIRTWQKTRLATSPGLNPSGGSTE